MSETPADQCGRDLRRLDPDRWLTALFAPDASRPGLFALYAFNAEIARARESVSQPMIGQIRLQWWREAWEGIAAGKPRQHPVVLALHEHCRDLDQSVVMALIDARERDMEDACFADLAALTDYARATSVPLMKLALQQLNAQANGAVVDAAGTAYALTGILRAAPHLLAQQRVLLPLDLLAAQGLTPEAAYQIEAGTALRPVFTQIATEAEIQLNRARQQKIVRAALPALLPATLAGLALKALRRNNHDPVAAETAITPLKRQMALLWASLRGRF
ncbi:squalene/phytoene synthase family protein [Ferrovibrio sp.]|uniref:phytoene/squalene synthase family protein n=1 Tax=Ferrovibrio sp. TaxID=1917215 RepID=UPI000CCB4AF2|nr:squalene/phytoene synthase family protein [Ferrovibrio sp.]PJI37835.1 MAG: phytoene synthase [Ferrovibrio sp.]